ncbi:uncharacterized protein LOC106880777 [Octopus bimaculoides]|uniref:uncharacterized protein LOC106880777 n=1 Tax=Octopus bimaculoides TaxID=37653 RepID=UPI0022E3B24B|nr:uncharacterized protein LOC106880777 [Octopus bimaculoides]
MCQKNPLNGNPLKVDTIEEINSVQVKNVSSNVSSESLGSYFGDRKKSSGGDISSIQQETNGTYIVSFKEAFVVLDVCTRDHILQNVELDVQPFWEPFEENIISRQQVYDYLQNLRKDISSKDGTFRSQDIQESEAGKNEMQNESESIISLNSDLGSETEEILNFKYKNCEIVLREGDITTLDTDAIVNAANGRLEHMGGIAAAIVRKGGFEIQAESNEIMKQRRIELKPGEVVSTKAGKLKCKTIIHAVGPVWSNGWNHEIFHLSRAVQNCLLFLEAKSYTSIAIPAISTGIFGIPIEEGTTCTVMAMKYYLDIHSNSKIKHICLIDVRKEVIRGFKHRLETVFGISECEGRNCYLFNHHHHHPKLPNPVIDPTLFEIVKNHMVHEPCGCINRSSPHMAGGKCTKRYPKKFLLQTQFSEYGYPSHARRTPEDGGVSNYGCLPWIVPFCLFVSKAFHAHINVEFCSSVKSIKYVCKNINKGSADAITALQQENVQDEGSQYKLGRNISSNDPFWCILGFPIHERHPAIQQHLENGLREFLSLTKHLYM